MEHSSKNSKSRDIYFMEHAIAMAELRLGLTAPNPSVGCVIVKDDEIIAEAVTEKGGRPHAEYLAIKKAGKKIEDSTLYVTLEPCCHHGVTEPCTDLIIKSGVKRVVIASIDPDNRVCGNGIKLLEDAGVEVEAGVCTSEADKLIAGFRKNRLYNKPLVTLKIATSLDGKIALANKTSQWITGEKAREYTHYLRAKNEAIMVGIGTVLADDPMLNCRYKNDNYPNRPRIILDTGLRIQTDCRLVNTANDFPVWVIYNSGDSKKIEQLQAKGVKLIKAKLGSSNSLDINDALEKIAENGINLLMVEGGAAVITSLITSNNLDSLVWVNSGMLLGSDSIGAIAELGLEKLPDAPNFSLEEYFVLDNDMIRVYSSNKYEIK